MIESPIRAIIKLAEKNYTPKEIIKIVSIIYEKTNEEVIKRIGYIEKEGVMFKNNKWIF